MDNFASFLITLIACQSYFSIVMIMITQKLREWWNEQQRRQKTPKTLIPQQPCPPQSYAGHMSLWYKVCALANKPNVCPVLFECSAYVLRLLNDVST
jgi:hypothetical protein